MHAVAARSVSKLEARDLALLCQARGEPRRRCAVRRDGPDDVRLRRARDALLALLCQPAELQPSVRCLRIMEFWGLDSGERHAVGGSDYGAVRTGAFMGLRMPRRHDAGAVDGLSGQRRAAEFERGLRGICPRRSGDDFLARYGDTTTP